MCSTNGGSAKALQLAIAYREKVILDMFVREGSMLGWPAVIASTNFKFKMAFRNNIFIKNPAM
jgi:hypothetical protein